MNCSTPLSYVLHYPPSLLKFMSIESMMLLNHLIVCHPILSPSIFPSIRFFSNESVLHIRCPKYWSFSLSISPSNGYSGLIFFFFLNGLVRSCCPRGSQESSPPPPFTSIKSLAPSCLYRPTLTSMHDYWKNHSFD